MISHMLINKEKWQDRLNRKLTRCHVLVIAGFWFLVATSSSYAQFTISGTVSDNTTGTPLAGANIPVENTYLSAITDKSGKFTFKNLKPGVYNLKVLYMGYETLSREISLSHDTVIHFPMKSKAILGEEVNIIATRAQSKTPTTFSTLSLKQIEAVNTGQDMPYILQSTPSVVVTSDAGTGIGYTGINIRGTDLTRINVTLNGIPVNDAESQGVWFVDLPDLASSTENIQVQRGVGTSTNGAGAFGATINIQTLKSLPDPYAELDLSGGSYGTLKSTIRFGSGLMKEGFSIDGRASYITSDGYIDRAFARLYSFYLSAGYFRKSTTLKFNILNGNEKTYQAWEGVPKDSLATNRRYNPSGEYTDRNGNLAYYDNQTDNYRQTHYQLIFSQEVGKKLNVNAALFYTKGNGYYENYEQDQSFASYGLQDVIIGNDTISGTDLINRKYLDNNFYGATFSANCHSLDPLKITLGGAWNYYDGQHYGRIIWAEYASNGSIERNWYDSPGRKTDLNFYAKISYRLLKKLTLFADLQYRHVYYTINGTLDDLRPVDQLNIFNFFNPKAGIYFDINDKQDIYFSFATGNREPNRNNYEVADRYNMPAPERLYDYELGYDLKFKNFMAGVNLYYMNYHDQLVLTGMINNVGEAIMTNVPVSYRAGIEISASARLFKWMKWNINGTLSSNKVRNFTEYVDNYDSSWNFTGQDTTFLGTTNLSFSPSILFTNTFAFTPFKNFTISLISRYVGKQYIDNTSSNDRSLQPWLVNNIAIGYSLRTKIFREVGFNLMANNIFSSKYESNGWVYRYYYGGVASESNGYFPQALINFLVGVTIRI
jgi:iron complex outermembrane recepter protein